MRDLTLCFMWIVAAIIWFSIGGALGSIVGFGCCIRTARHLWSAFENG